MPGSALLVFIPKTWEALQHAKTESPLLYSLIMGRQAPPVTHGNIVCRCGTTNYVYTDDITSTVRCWRCAAPLIEMLRL